MLLYPSQDNLDWRPKEEGGREREREKIEGRKEKLTVGLLLTFLINGVINKFFILQLNS